MRRPRSGSHIFLRGSTWYYRRIVPAEFRAAFGCTVVAVSLYTGNEAEARELEKQHDVEFVRRLQRAREVVDPSALSQRIAQATGLDIRLSNRWCGVPTEPYLSDDERLRAMSLANRHLLPRHNLVSELAGLLAPLSGEQIAAQHERIVTFVRHQIASATGETMPPVSASAMSSVHTLDWTWDRWLRAGDGDRTPETIKTARRHWMAFCEHCGLTMLDQVRRSHLVAWRDALVDGGKYAAKSINQRIQLVSAILRAGWRDAEMAQPDLKTIPLPEPDDSGRGAWTRAEILTALHALEPGSWSAWVYLIALTTAVRMGEPLAARVNWFDGRFINVMDRSATKANKLHALPIIECLRAPLAQYVAGRSADGFLFAAPHPADPEVSVSKVASQWFQRFFKRNQIDRVFHELRDTWIEEARHSPVKREIWEIISGHSKATVSDRYGGEKPEVLATANEDVCGFLMNDAEIKSAMLRLVS